MRLGNTIKLLIPVSISLFFFSCRYTVLDKETVGLYPPGKIYGQWVSVYKQHTGSFLNPGIYSENFSMTLDKDSSFIIFKTEGNDLGQKNDSRIRGTYRINRDTMTISIEKYPGKVEKYLFKLSKDDLSFVLISEPFPDVKVIPSMRPDKTQTLEKNWRRY